MKRGEPDNQNVPVLTDVEYQALLQMARNRDRSAGMVEARVIISPSRAFDLHSWIDETLPVVLSAAILLAATTFLLFCVVINIVY